MSKKVLLFGGSGLLGTELQRALASCDMHVVAPAHEEANLCEYKSLEAVITQEMPDLIINAAACIDVDELEKDPLRGWEVNAFGAAAIARILAKHSLGSAYIFISTNYVFGADTTVHGEDDAPAPVNTYGSTKALAETLIAQYFAGRSERFYLIRTGWIYSVVRPTFVDDVAKNLRAGNDFKASIDQRGNLTNASDFANALVSEFIEGDHQSGAYHIANASEGGLGVSRFDIAVEISRILNVPTSLIKKAPSAAIFTTKRPSAVLRNTKLTALRDWREPLREYILRQYGQ